MKLKEDYKKLQFLLSDESLTLLPEYQQRIQVLVSSYHKVPKFWTHTYFTVNTIKFKLRVSTML